MGRKKGTVEFDETMKLEMHEHIVWEKWIDIKMVKISTITSTTINQVENGLVPAVVEFDALGVVNLIGSGVSLDADVGLIVSDIQHQLCVSAMVSVSYVLQQANGAAHSLAKMALAIDDDCFWVEEVPSFVSLYLGI
ncbi:hypothetical protein Q3G72_013012 [Acer saccharum]|nr:hypothetical protein Q3G72_013012 [Acer saccharum]